MDSPGQVAPGDLYGNGGRKLVCRWSCHRGYLHQVMVGWEPSGTSLPISVSTNGIARALVLGVGTRESENPRMSCPGGLSWEDPRRGSLRVRNRGWPWA